VSYQIGVKHVCAYIPVQIYEEMLKEKARTGKSINDIILEELMDRYKEALKQNEEGKQ
jgi:hypothetical protein